MIEDMVCPRCGTSDFKIEDGCYVCQICGEQIPKEDNYKKPTRTRRQIVDKRVDKIISLVIFFFVIIASIIPIVNVPSMPNIAFYSICIASMIFFIFLTVRKMYGLYYFSPIITGVVFGFFVLAEACTIFINLLGGGTFSTLSLVKVFLVAAVWVSVYKLDKWIR